MSEARKFVCFFIYCLGIFHCAVNSSDYTVVTGNMIGEYRIVKEVEESNHVICPGICL
jgi:hypothetical protein